MEYQQFCPVAKASELLGDKWTILILREALMGAKRFNEFERGLGRISPTMLTKRLNELVINGLMIRKKITGQKGNEYFLTQAGKDVNPVIMQLGDWGMRWARGQMENSDLDVELLMLYLQRSIRTDKLAGDQTIIQFNFTNLTKLGKWWLVVHRDEVDVCLEDPGKEVDVWFVTDLRTMVEVWMGDITYRKAIREKRLKLIGPVSLINNITNWMANSVYAGIPRAVEI
jgi:DNA-binding HxlR family transcriptional regulator